MSARKRWWVLAGAAVVLAAVVVIAADGTDLLPTLRQRSHEEGGQLVRLILGEAGEATATDHDEPTLF
jgi:hypothetical protein